MLIGREVELSVAAECLGAAQGGHTRTLTVTGAAGIGKTALCRRIAALSTEKGAAAVWGSCSRAPGAPVYSPFIRLLRSIERAISKPAFERLMDAQPGVREFLAEEALAPGDASNAHRSLFELFNMIAALLRRASDSIPLTIVLDDFQGAAPACWLLLHFLVHQLVDARLFFLAAYREPKARTSPSAARWMADLLCVPGVTAVPLRCLDGLQVRSFLETETGTSPSQSTVDYLLEQTGGNPFYLEQMMPMLRAHPGASNGNPAARVPALPRDVRDAVESHISTLPGAARSALEAGAVIGAEFALDVLGHVLGLKSAHVHQLLEPALASGFVTETDRTAGRFMRFAHLIVRDTLYLGIPASSRARLQQLAREAGKRAGVC
jgi:predicted ATPase